MARPPMIIRARVRARLLGLPLLTLDACVIAGEGDAPVPAIRPAGLPAARPAGRAAAPGTSVRRARELVREGALALDEQRGRR